MKQKIVTVTTGFKSSNDCQVEFETNIEKWLQVGWQVKQVVSTTFQYQASLTNVVEHVKINKEQELEKNSNVQNLHIANSDRSGKLYSLDVSFSVGCL